jgi:hypothetical protein
MYSDDANLKGSMKELKVSKNGTYEINVPMNGATIFVGKE